MTDLSDIAHGYAASTSRRPKFLSGSLNLLLPLAEVAVIIAVSSACGVAYHLAVYGAPGFIADYAAVGVLVALFYLLPQQIENANELVSKSTLPDILLRLTYLWNFGFFCLLVAAFVLKISADYSRGALLLFYVVGFPALAALRFAYAQWLRSGFRRGALAVRHGLLLGSAPRVGEFHSRYRPSDYGFHMTDVVLLPDGGIPAADRTVHLERAVSEAIARTRSQRFDDIFILVPWSDTATIEYCTEALMTVPASIYVGPEEVFDRFANVEVSKVGAATSLKLLRPPLDSLQVLSKRAFDIAVSAAALVVLLPLFLLVALAIRLDSTGPVLFLQRRHGFNQKPFRIIKFRTMTVAEDGPVVAQATADDPRITRVGRYLRRWNLDELPQVVNVLLGDMSLVGPRPHALTHDRHYERRIARYARRHNVKPGITGWAQVNGYRGLTDTDEKMQARLRFDLYYIDHWSILFDLYIIALTVVSPRAFRNAG